MRAIVTTLSIAGAIAFGAVGAAATAAAAIVPPTGNVSIAAAGNAADTRSDHYRECVERARINGYQGLPVASVEGCQVASPVGPVSPGGR